MLRAVASLHALRAFEMRALDKGLRARVNYSGALLSILRPVAFCSRVFVKLKSSGTVHEVAKNRDQLLNFSCKFMYSWLIFALCSIE